MYFYYALYVLLIKVQHHQPEPALKTMAMKCLTKPTGEREIAHVKMEKRILKLAHQSDFVVR